MGRKPKASYRVKEGDIVEVFNIDPKLKIQKKIKLLNTNQQKRKR